MGRINRRLWIGLALCACVACASKPRAAAPSNHAGFGKSASDAGASDAAHSMPRIDSGARDASMQDAGTSAAGDAGPAADSATPTPTDAGPIALQWDSPTADAPLSGTKSILRLTGHGFLNVEIKSGTTLIARAMVSADHTSATASVDTTVFPNGPVTWTAHAWDVTAGQMPVHDIDAGPRSFTIDNGASATTIYGNMVGVCAYRSDDFAALQALGIKHARMDRPDAATIDEARKYGVEVLPIADYGFTDLSGSSDYKAPPLPQNRGAWAKRMVDLWRDMANPPKVIEVWNEPYGAGFWPPAANAGDYLALVQAFAAEAWAVWPEETLLVAGDTIGSDPNYQWRDELLKADTTGFLNDPRILPTSHPYTQARTPTQVVAEPCKWDLDRFDCVYKAWKAHGHPDPQVWVTEYGWQSVTPGSVTDSPMTDLVSEQLQADYMKQALQIFRDSGEVAHAFAFLYSSTDKWNYNWVRPDGTQKPVCSTVKTLIATGK